MPCPRYSWPKFQLDEALSTALKGKAYSVQLLTPELAKRFRFALYNRRRQLPAAYKTLSIVLDQNLVTVYKPIELTINRKASEEKELSNVS